MRDAVYGDRHLAVARDQRNGTVAATIDSTDGTSSVSK
jgi:hypothetical protein